MPANPPGRDPAEQVDELCFFHQEITDQHHSAKARQWRLLRQVLVDRVARHIAQD